DLADAVDNDPLLIVPPLTLAQAHGGFDARVLSAGDEHSRYGPRSPKVQQSQATGAANSTASMMSSTPPNPGSQVLLSLHCMSRFSSDSARSPAIPASASKAP